MGDRRIEVRPVAGALGAEILGLDLAGPVDDEAFAEIHRAFLDHLVIFFRDQELTPAHLRAFASRFGRPNRYPFVEGLPGTPEVIEVVKEEHETANFGGGWHSDTTYLELPPRATCLYAKRVPAVGGDTLFSNMHLAYETLSDGMKRMLDGLVAINSAALRNNKGAARRLGFNSMKSQNMDKVEMCAEHPVVRTHPETGRKALYVNSLHTTHFKDMTEEESAPLIDCLCEHAVRPEFTCRFRWQPGSLALWDNRAAQHNAINDYHGHRRVMHRVTIEGDRPR